MCSILCPGDRALCIGNGAKLLSLRKESQERGSAAGREGEREKENRDPERERQRKNREAERKRNEKPRATETVGDKER